MATKADYIKFQKLRANFVKARDEHISFDTKLRMKYGPGSLFTMMSGSERKKMDSIRAKMDKASNDMFELLSRISPRNWEIGVPLHWVMMDLSWEDAVTSGPLSSVPEGGYNSDPKYLRELQEKPNRSGGSRRKPNHVTKQGRYGLLKLFEIVYKDDGDKASPEFTTRKWAYDFNHAIEDFYESNSGDSWVIDKIAIVQEDVPKHRWAWR